MVIVRAPARVSFGGGGTDLSAYYSRYGGFVVSAAITRYSSVMAYRPRDARIRITSTDFHVREDFAPGTIPRVREPLSLPKAAIARFARHGIREDGVDLLLTSEVPPGTGLGSSSAMAVALARALAEYTGESLNRGDVAEIACQLEIEYLGMPIGKQDQYASAFGGVNTIEFSDDGVSVRPIAIARSVLTALDERLLLFWTGQRREAASILRQQRQDTRDNPAVIESLHRLKRLAIEMAETICAQDLDGFGRLLHAGWMEKRRLSCRVSSSAIDAWYEAARNAGAIGGKITGAGGGGFLLLYVSPNRQASVRAVMSRMGLEETPFRFDYDGVKTLTSARDMSVASDRQGAAQRLLVAMAAAGLLADTGRTDLHA